jgi:transcriptional regulator with XRE-family HTH domain
MHAEDELTARVAHRVRELRKRAGLSIEALAQHANLPYETVARLERGETSPRLPTLARIAKALGVDPMLFFWVETDGGPMVPEHVKELLPLLVDRTPEEVRRVRVVLDAMFGGDQGGTQT